MFQMELSPIVAATEAIEHPPLLVALLDVKVPLEFDAHGADQAADVKRLALIIAVLANHSFSFKTSRAC
ncbi:hypothetical protein HED54_24955 [Ochrobactrum anthropi ATCC 49188]|nr:hypothetical protein [Brucella anthropi ATCC 49188]